MLPVQQKYSKYSIFKKMKLQVPQSQPWRFIKLSRIPTSVPLTDSTRHIVHVVMCCQSTINLYEASGHPSVWHRCTTHFNRLGTERPPTLFIIEVKVRETACSLQ